MLRGDRIGIIGPNGAGKTTLFNCISGIYAPEEGQVIFQGRDITGWKPYHVAHLGLARTHQIVQPLEELTVLENVMLPLELTGYANAQKRAREALESSDSHASVVKRVNTIFLQGTAPLYIDDTGSISVLEMRAKARRLQAEKGLGMIIVDYLQLMRGRSSEGREKEISEISRGLKALAKDVHRRYESVEQFAQGFTLAPQ